MTTPFLTAVHKAPLYNNVTLIASGKGGVGKTWFSITLSQLLAKRGRRVLVVDADLGMANLDIQLGISPTYDLSHVIQGQCPINQAITRSPDNSFDVLAGRSGHGQMSFVTSDKIAFLLSQLTSLQGHYDHIFMDLGAGLDAQTRQLTAPASHCLLIITDEPTSLTDGYAFIKVMRQLKPLLTMDVVVNQASDVNQGQRVYEAFAQVCQKFLNLTPGLGGVVRRDSRVHETIRAQAPLMVRFPQAPALMDMEHVAHTFAKRTPV